MSLDGLIGNEKKELRKLYLQYKARKLRLDSALSDFLEVVKQMKANPDYAATASTEDKSSIDSADTKYKGVL
jgi:hypothetical protein